MKLSKSTILIFSGVVLIATLVLLLVRERRMVIPGIKVFYEKQIITRFDDAGNPYGISVLYRQDGVGGKKYALLTRNDEHRLDSVQSVYNIQDGKLVQTVATDNGAVTTALYEFSGSTLGRTTTNFVASTFPASLTSADGAVKVITSEPCTKEVAEGPCPMTFSLSIEKPVGKVVRRLMAKDIPGTGAGNFYALPVAFSKDGQKLFLFVSQFGDSLNPASFDAVDLHTFSVTQLLVAHHPADADVQSIDGLSFICTSADGTTLFVEKTFGDPQKSNQLLKITLEPWTVQTIATVPEGVQAQELKPDDSGVVQQKSEGGLSLIDFSTGVSTTLTQQGYFLQWSHDGKYYLYRILDDNHNGLGPYKLMVGSLETGEQKEIVRQTVTAQSYGTSTRAGDILYAPVGIW